MHCLIVIPTYNRAGSLGPAIEAALAQSWRDLTVAVVDDGSTDDTADVCAGFAADPRFVAIHLARNVGTAQAKNVGLALLPFDAVTFHDSDDLPHRDKLARQARVMARSDLIADPCLPWGPRQGAGAPAPLHLVLTAHDHVTADGGQVKICRALSLVDDFFPNLQFNTGPLGDWVLINSGLFRREMLAQAGGFADCIEEDREIRNRLLMHGANVWLIEDALLTKFESPDSLTVQGATGYRSSRRERDRQAVWRAIETWRRDGVAPVQTMDLANVSLRQVVNPGRLAVAADLAMTPESRVQLAAQVAAAQAGHAMRAAA
ncbi:glycosyltransferase family 2 protein [Sandaracinobacteroides saxicola]|uniref:Glycosyltransferase n=1 Tax=Sandaracinobacteroides saxicola TaxID=2759707 RepID=A0A7G5IEG6_9SPHN|nr:glycosyltransferase [Sandaracinobacteroides saxicola]QMW21758.1 glycosyltransferase [Sandaracinobacteroides saxicola]